MLTVHTTITWQRCLKGHQTYGRLNPNERIHLHEMAESNNPPRKILSNLTKRNNTTSTTIKHIYNVCHMYRKSIEGSRTEMQHHLKSVVENEYVYHCRNYPDFVDVDDILWVHPNGIKLFNTFSMMIVLDSTYKSNKYCLLLLEFICNTSTQLTFSIGFAYMMSQKEDNVTWTLERCRELLHSKAIYPKVVVTDWDNALMKCCGYHFP